LGEGNANDGRQWTQVALGFGKANQGPNLWYLAFSRQALPKRPCDHVTIYTGESAFLVSEMDITAKKKLEKENSDKDTFLGMVHYAVAQLFLFENSNSYLAWRQVSHEIRTPINGILGFNSLLLETNQTEEQRDFTLSIQRSAKLLLAHVNDLLDFAKIAEGKLRMVRSHQTNLLSACDP
jgi:hypothetical protein